MKKRKGHNSFFLWETTTFAQFELNNKNEEMSKHVRESLSNSFHAAKVFLENNMN